FRDAARPDAVAASIPELDQVASGYRHILREGGGSAAGELENAVKLAKGIFRRGAIDRHDHLVTPPRGAVAGGGDRALGRGAGDDHGLDAFFLQARVEIGAYELVAAAPVLDHE